MGGVTETSLVAMPGFECFIYWGGEFTCAHLLCFLIAYSFYLENKSKCYILHNILIKTLTNKQQNLRKVFEFNALFRGSQDHHQAHP